MTGPLFDSARAVLPFVAVTLGLALSACGESPKPAAPQPKAEPSDQGLSLTASPDLDAGKPTETASIEGAKFIPPAPGSGNFEVCLLKEAAENEITRVTIPANILFASWGPIVKDLREAQNFDPRVMDTTPTAKEMQSYALVTTTSVTLTTEQPCRRTNVRVAMSREFDWTQPEGFESLHYVFAPYPNVLHGHTVSVDQWGQSTTGKAGGPSLGGKLGDAIGGEQFVGVLLKDVADPVELKPVP